MTGAGPDAGKPRRTWRHEQVVRLVLLHAGRVLLVRMTDPGVPDMQPWLAVPTVTLHEGEGWSGAALRGLRAIAGGTVSQAQLWPALVAVRDVHHGYSDRVLRHQETFHRVELTDDQARHVDVAATFPEAAEEVPRLVGHGWYRLDELGDEAVLPPQLADLVEATPGATLTLRGGQESSLRWHPDEPLAHDPPEQETPVVWYHTDRAWRGSDAHVVLRSNVVVVEVLLPARSDRAGRQWRYTVLPRTVDDQTLGRTVRDGLEACSQVVEGNDPLEVCFQRAGTPWWTDAERPVYEVVGASGARSFVWGSRIAAVHPSDDAVVRVSSQHADWNGGFGSVRGDFTTDVPLDIDDAGLGAAIREAWRHSYPRKRSMKNPPPVVDMPELPDQQ